MKIAPFNHYYNKSLYVFFFIRNACVFNFLLKSQQKIISQKIKLYDSKSQLDNIYDE